MRPTVSTETARAWLEEQLSQLSQFRNANIRDAQFKQWRQNTLTVVQRIWPGVTAKSRRFRRVPFSPPSSLADTKQMREAFERGCAEVGLLLRQWITEIEEHGVRHEPSEGAMAAGSDPEAGATMIDLDAPARPPRDEHVETIRTLDLSAVLGGRLPQSQPASPKPTSSKRRPGRSTTAANGAANEAAPPSPPPSAATPPAAAPPAAAPPAAAPTPAAEPVAASKMPADVPPLSIVPPPAAPAAGASARDEKPRGRATKKKNGARLKDMLGLADFSVPEDPMPADATAASPGRGPDGSHEGVAEVVNARAIDAVPADVSGVAAARALDVANVDASGAAAARALEVTIDLVPEPEIPMLQVIGPEPVAPLSSSADVMPPLDLAPPMAHVIALVPEAPAVRPETPEHHAASEPHEGAGATAIALLATELGTMDLPAAEREWLQRALIDLALHLESGAGTWAELREVVRRTMDHPELARRALPAIVPFLDRIG